MISTAVFAHCDSGYAIAVYVAICELLIDYTNKDISA